MKLKLPECPDCNDTGWYDNQVVWHCKSGDNIYTEQPPTCQDHKTVLGCRYKLRNNDLDIKLIMCDCRLCTSK